jgi:hypothetical protein
MMTEISLRNDLKAKGMSISKKNREVISAFQSGIADGLADHVNRGLLVARRNYFVDTYRAQGKSAAAANRKGKAAVYSAFPGANKPDKKGVMKFVKGKIVNRSGQMQEAIYPVNFRRMAFHYVGTNSSPDMEVTISAIGSNKEAKINISGRTGMLMRIHVNKSRIRILELAFRVISRQLKTLVAAGIEKKLEPTKVLRK